MIPTRPIGTTGLNLSIVGFGSAPIGDLRRAPSNDAAHSLLQAAWDRGLRYFDTAPMYGVGLSERRIGDFLREKPRDEYVLSTKVGRLQVPDRAHALKAYDGDRRAMPFRNVFDYTYDGIMRSHEQSLQRLGLERIDILYLHDLGKFSQRDRHEETLKQALAGGGVRALEELRASGTVKAIGAGVNEWPILDLLMDHAKWDVFLLANRYTLLDQAVLDTFLPRCVTEGVAIVDGAPLNAGILATGAVPGAMYDYAPAPEVILEKVRRIEAVCRTHNVPMIHAALAFPLGHEAVASIIPGPSTTAEFTSNFAAYTTAMPAALWDDLKREGVLHADAPPPRTPDPLVLKVEHLVDNRPLAEALLENWHFDLEDPSRFEKFRISSNAIYPFHADGELQFLRFAPASEKRAGSVQAELDFIAYLRANGYPAAEPVPGKSGELVVQRETPWGTYVASVFRRVPGVQLGRTDFSEEIVRGYGAALGALHWLSERYAPTGTRRWNHVAVLHWCSETLAMFPDTSAAVAETEILARHFDGITKIGGIYGLVHYDFECDNVLYDAATKTFGVIDFDDAMEHWFAMDLEQALDSLADESGRDLSAIFLAGYASQLPVTDDLIALRPVCRRFADLFWYTRARRAVALVQPDEPQWLIDLRSRIADGMARRAARFGTPLDHP